MSRSFNELTRQRKVLGNVGALDFLIAIERKKMASTNELSTKLREFDNSYSPSEPDESQLNPLQKSLRESLILNQQLNMEIKRLTAEKTKLHSKCDQLEQSLNDRFRELAVLSQLILDKGNP